MKDRKKYMREWRLKNREHLRTYEKKRWVENKKERTQQFKKWREKNLEKELLKKREYAKQYRTRTKKDVLSHYSNGELKCNHCEFNDIRALTIDHIENNGAKHRKRVGGSGHSVYLDIKKSGYPKGYQVLCRNCNWIKQCSLWG